MSTTAIALEQEDNPQEDGETTTGIPKEFLDAIQDVMQKQLMDLDDALRDDQEKGKP